MRTATFYYNTISTNYLCNYHYHKETNQAFTNLNAQFYIPSSGQRMKDYKKWQYSELIGMGIAF